MKKSRCTEGADYVCVEAGGSGHGSERVVSTVGRESSDVLSMAKEVPRNGCDGTEAVASVGG